MNLGLVVLSANNEVLFQANLVTAVSLTTQFTLPAAGQYTIGVFRISYSLNPLLCNDHASVIVYACHLGGGETIYR